jgi:hypothetical protein
MTQTRIPTQPSDTAPSQPWQGRPQQASSRRGHMRHLSPFWRHFLEMLAAMVVGMLVTGAIFLSIVGLKTWNEVTLQYPTQSLLAMAAGMTIPMVAWMLFRGDGRQVRLRDGGGYGAPGRSVPVPGLVRRHSERMVWGVLRDDDRGHAGADALPPQYLLDSDVGRATDISPPNDSVNVFPEYARSETWTAVHIRQFVSTPFIVLAFSDTPGSSATPHPR